LRVLITGKSGFVGKNLTKFLIPKGFDLIFVGREKGKSQISWAEIGDSKLNADVIIHLAGKAHDLKNVASPEEYYQVNFELSKKIYDSFLDSEANLFIFLSSVKAVADEVLGELTEDQEPNPQTHYGKSKLKAEQYIMKNLPKDGKRVVILRPCMIHGPFNKGNLNLLYGLASKKIPWPLGAYQNARSFCSIENLLFVICELIKQKEIPSGVYNIADDEVLSTNDLISLIGDVIGTKPKIWNIDPTIIMLISRFGDFLKLPLNSERLKKLTESYIVSNRKLRFAIGKPFPVSSRDGLIQTLKSFS
jgi:nucleoside-diphosphate-sugar epimerase